MKLEIEPCTKVSEKTIREWLAKLDEEINEFKAEIFEYQYLDNTAEETYIDENDRPMIEEGCDVIVVIMSMLKNMNVPDEEIAKAMQYVNEHNRQRGRIDEYVPDKTDNVNHPAHYNQGGIECIDLIKEFTREHFVGYLQGNALKYMYRYNMKGGAEDLEKAKWYISRLAEEEAHDNT